MTTDATLASAQASSITGGSVNATGGTPLP